MKTNTCCNEFRMLRPVSHSNLQKNLCLDWNARMVMRRYHKIEYNSCIFLSFLQVLDLNHILHNAAEDIRSLWFQGRIDYILFPFFTYILLVYACLNLIWNRHKHCYSNDFINRTTQWKACLTLTAIRVWRYTWHYTLHANQFTYITDLILIEWCCNLLHVSHWLIFFYRYSSWE